MSHAPRATSFDWDAVLSRLAQAARPVEHDRQLSDEAIQAILVERARVLAQIPPQDNDQTDRLELLVFRWGDERLAVETKFVKEVGRLGHVTPLPGAPDFFVGLSNLRGEMLAVLDLRTTFGLAATDFAARVSAPLIVLGGARPELGLLADDIEGVEQIPDRDLMEAPAYLSALGRDLVRGVTKNALWLLDGHVTLTDPRLFVDEQ